jgi:hypothetical protein
MIGSRITRRRGLGDALVVDAASSGSREGSPVPALHPGQSESRSGAEDQRERKGFTESVLPDQ